MMKMETSNLNLRRTDVNQVSKYELRSASRIVFKSHKKTKEWEHDFTNEIWYPVKSNVALTIPDIMANINFMIDDYEKKNIDFELQIFKRDTEYFWHNITNLNENGIVDGKSTKYINLDYDSEEEFECEDSYQNEDEFSILKEDILEYLIEKKENMDKVEALMAFFVPENKRNSKDYHPLVTTVSDEKKTLEDFISRLSN